MSSKHLSNDEFLHQLSSLLSSTHASSHGSVFLTQKSLSPTTAITAATMPELQSPTVSKILIRATNGKSKSHRQPSSDIDSRKEKLSTVVEAADLTAFYARYAEVCKKGMEGLRKRDKKKAKARRKKKDDGGAGAGAGPKAGVGLKAS